MWFRKPPIGTDIILTRNVRVLKPRLHFLIVPFLVRGILANLVIDSFHDFARLRHALKDETTVCASSPATHITKTKECWEKTVDGY